ncbi:putative cyclic nucleotide-gated ion channel 8 isoform X2 [Neltuma alba]|uniref:putative cyclic nucleotide-gated ion channel 8 isoform X2 n=1 Tax=Neltuma alba TaxID=207710 RepID=UPI0010A438E4|nr:putative cyclic nucleotide-gated ion channel 8 isoform X2 [Prosopis alba]XP_028781335.1 putative cyclic nucleotide-gated ion channel 8 isoform X2 [Prosopis alba]
MFNSCYNSYGQRDKFVRLDDLDSNTSVQSSPSGIMKKLRFNIEGKPISGRENKNASKSFRMGMKRGSDGLKTFGRSLKSGVTWQVFPEDLKVSETKIFDPQDKTLLLWNKFFELLCIISVSCDPLFFYLPYFNLRSHCLAIDTALASTAIILRSVLDAIYLIRMGFQFRTAYIAPSSRVFGRGELVIDPKKIAKRYLGRYFIVDFSSVLPLPQIVVANYLQKAKSLEVLATKTTLLRVVILQYIPRFARFIPLATEVKKTAAVFSDNALVGATYYLVWYMLVSHIVGSVWYLLAIERNDTCWQKACAAAVTQGCIPHFLYCESSNRRHPGYEAWKNVNGDILDRNCGAGGEDPPFDYGIYTRVIEKGITASSDMWSKFFLCFWWGLQNVSTLGQGLDTSTYIGEALFSIFICILGLVLMALLIGKVQNYLQSITVRLEEMRIKRRDSEQWMHHRVLPQELRERVRRYDQYKWMETRGVDEENLVQNLPKDLRRDIKRHLCLNLVRRVPLFANMDERLLDAICERLKPSLYTEGTYIVREGDPVVEMFFIIRGRLESVTTDGGRSGFFNRGLLKEGDFCGEELLTWALDPKSAANLPSSTRTVKAINEVEAFALEAEMLKFVASQFRRLHSRQVQQTFRFYSQQWRTWAATFIQAAWRRYMKRKMMESQLIEEEEEEMEDEDEDYGSDDDGKALISRTESSSRAGFGSTIYASRFAAKALRGRKLRSLQKPPEPDFSVYDHRH